MDRVSRLVTFQTCGPEGLQSQSVTIYGWRNKAGDDDLDTIEEQFKLLSEISKQQCEEQECDYNIGIPMRAFEGDTPEHCVFYFNDERTTKNGIGRYIQIPYPNLDLIRNIPTDRRIDYEPGRWYAYVQYGSGRGPKLAVFAATREDANAKLTEFRGYVRENVAGVYHIGEAREVTSKNLLQLQLKRITLFPPGNEISGREQPEVIWKRRTF